MCIVIIFTAAIVIIMWRQVVRGVFRGVSTTITDIGVVL